MLQSTRPCRSGCISSRPGYSPCLVCHAGRKAQSTCPSHVQYHQLAGLPADTGQVCVGESLILPRPVRTSISVYDSIADGTAWKGPRPPGMPVRCRPVQSQSYNTLLERSRFQCCPLQRAAAAVLLYCPQLMTCHQFTMDKLAVRSLWALLTLLTLRVSAACTSYGVDYSNGGSYYIDGSSNDYFSFASVFQGKLAVWFVGIEC